jgi:hypothetical protein
VIRERAGYDLEQPEYIRNSAGNVPDHPRTSGFDSEWNKIFNITGVFRDDQRSIALPFSSLALPKTTEVTPEKHRSFAGTNRGRSGA